MASPTSYPPGGTFFDTLKRSFTQVPVNADKANAIGTTEFLDAAESLTTLFGETASRFSSVWDDWVNVKLRAGQC